MSIKYEVRFSNHPDDAKQYGTERLRKEFLVETLMVPGEINLDTEVQGGDAGIPAVAQREPGPAAEVMREMSRQVAARMSVRAAEPGPETGECE